MTARRLILGSVVASVVPTGCVNRGPAELDSPLPSRRTDVLTSAQSLEDPSTIPGRIELLDSDDPLVRMLAIRSLERMTGQTLGYDHAAGQLERDQAVARWVEWYERTGGQVSPGDPEAP